MERNPIDKIWTANRSPIPTGLLRIHPSEYAGKSTKQKLIDIRAVMHENQVGYVCVYVLNIIDLI